MARPTTWSKELEEKAWEYINGGWQDAGDKVPMVVGLCSYIERSKAIIYDWATQPDKQFSDIVKAIGEKQEEVLFNKSLIGEYNSTMSKLMLTKHGYSDKVDTDLTSGGKPVKNEWHIHPTSPRKDADS